MPAQPGPLTRKRSPQATPRNQGTRQMAKSLKTKTAFCISLVAPIGAFLYNNGDARCLTRCFFEKKKVDFVQYYRTKWTLKLLIAGIAMSLIARLVSRNSAQLARAYSRKSRGKAKNWAREHIADPFVKQVQPSHESLGLGIVKITHYGTLK